MQEVTTGMIKKGIANMKLVDAEEGRRKIKLWAQQDVKTLIYMSSVMIITHL